MYGIAKMSNMIAVKVLNSQGSGSSADIIAGINWVVVEDQLSLNRAVINMSLGANGVYTPLNDAVNNAVKAGVVVAVAAGNSNVDACGTTPASAADAITVGATKKDDARASFSNYGVCVDIFAPGVDIVSCATTNNPVQSSYSTKNGTSMSSPHVAGVAALLLEEDPTLTPAQLADRMLADATPGVVDAAGPGSPNLMLCTGKINERATVPTSAPFVSLPFPAPAPAPIVIYP
jgi:subtilisin family serine protease